MAEAILGGLDGVIVEFCRFARANGLLAGVKESLGALEAVEVVGMTDRETLKTALRAVLCSSKADWDLFEELFEAFWTSAERTPHRPRTKRTHPAHEPKSQEKAG